MGDRISILDRHGHEITESTIRDFTLSRYVDTGDTAMFGSCCASQVKFSVYADLLPEGFVFTDDLDITVYPDGESDAHIGLFVVESIPRNNAGILEVTALDYMGNLNVAIEGITYPTTPQGIVTQICGIFGYGYWFGSETMPNSSYAINEAPDGVTTYRDLLSYACEIMGANAYFAGDALGGGFLCVGWYGDVDANVTFTDETMFSEAHEGASAITGVVVTNGDTSYVAGLDDYPVRISQNPLITANWQEVANALWQARRATIVPSVIEVNATPIFYPMETIHVVSGDYTYTMYPTNIQYTLNGRTTLSMGGTIPNALERQLPHGTVSGVPLDDAVELLKQSILNTASSLTQAMETIEQTLHGEVVALSDEFGEYRQQSDARITQNAEGITQAYTNITTLDSKYDVITGDNSTAIVNLETGAVTSNTDFRRTTEAYIKTGLLYYDDENIPITGVAIGQLTYETVNGNKVIKREGMYTTYTAQELAFYIGSTKVAYFANNKLYITAGEFVDQVKVGKYILDDTGTGFTIRYGG